MANFYTIGLPRSRSLWLSMLLSSDMADCHHEALTPFGRNKLPNTVKPYVGSCDANPLNSVERDGPTIKIIRDPWEVIDSALKAFNNPFDRDFEPFVSAWVEKYDKALNQIDAPSYSFNDLSEIDCLKEIIKYLKPDDFVSDDRLVKMINIKIEAMNRDITESISHASEAYCMSVNNFYDHIVGGN